MAIHGAFRVAVFMHHFVPPGGNSVQEENMRNGKVHDLGEIAYMYERRGAVPDQDLPYKESIARARAAQERERNAFTRATGVAVNSNGVMMRP